jgi:hypothetical protein
MVGPSPRPEVFLRILDWLEAVDIQTLFPEGALESLDHRIVGRFSATAETDRYLVRVRSHMP